MRPLRITARMAEPILTYGDGLHLDGIIAWCAYRDLTEEQRWALPPITEEWAQDFDLPLARHHIDVPTIDGRLRNDVGAWVWLATVALIEAPKHGTHEVRKRVPTPELARWTTAVSVNPSHGPSKAYDLKYPTVWAPVVTWFAIGGRDELARLLVSHAYGVGKHCAKGMGRVIEWSVDHADIDEAFILDRRRVPVREDEATMIGGIRPPYHHISRQTWAREPAVVT